MKGFGCGDIVYVFLVRTDKSPQQTTGERSGSSSLRCCTSRSFVAGRQNKGGGLSVCFYVPGAL